MKQISARQALELWCAARLLTAEQAAELAAHLDREEAVPGQSRAITIFASIGVILVGLGILLFVGSNWSRMGPLSRTLVLAAAYALAVSAASVAQVKRYDRLARALWFLVTLSFGANIFFFGQIFHFTLTYWQGALVWLAGTLAMGYAIESRLHAWVAVPLAILTLGWLGGGSGWFFDDQFEFLWSKRGLRPLGAIIGLGLVALGILARQSTWRFGAGIWFAWGSWLMAFVLAISTAHRDALAVLFGAALTPMQVGILIATGLLVGAALLRGGCAPRSRIFFAGLAGLVFFLMLPGGGDRPWVVGQLWGWLPHLLYVILVFGLGLATVWIGLKASDRRLVNVGIAATAVVVSAQYVSWSFRLLDRSVAFIVGGLLLMGLAIGIERQRRRLLTGMGQ